MLQQTVQNAHMSDVPTVARCSRHDDTIQPGLSQVNTATRHIAMVLVPSTKLRTPYSISRLPLLNNRSKKLKHCTVSTVLQKYCPRHDGTQVKPGTLALYAEAKEAKIHVGLHYTISYSSTCMEVVSHNKPKW